MMATYTQQQITFYEELVSKIQEGLVALADNPTQSWSFDTGQTKESVKNYSLAELREYLEWAQGELAYWNSQLQPGGLVVRPGY